MARAMGSLSSFGQWMGSGWPVWHTISPVTLGELGHFLYEGPTFVFLVESQHPIDDPFCISRASSVRGLPVSVGGRRVEGSRVAVRSRARDLDISR